MKLLFTILYLPIDSGIVIMPDLGSKYKEYIIGAIVALLVAFIGYLGKNNFSAPRNTVKFLCRYLSIRRRRRRECYKRIKILEDEVQELRAENSSIKKFFEVWLTVLHSAGDSDVINERMSEMANEIINKRPNL